MPIVGVDIRAHTLNWIEDESDSDAAKSGNEKSPPKINLQDISVRDSDTKASMLTTPTTPANMSRLSKKFDGSDGKYLINFEIQLQPDLEHLEVLFKETKAVLVYMQQVNPTARYMPKPDSSHAAPFSSPTDPSWSTCHLAALSWYQTSTGYLFHQAPITDRQLTA